MACTHWTCLTYPTSAYSLGRYDQLEFSVFSTHASLISELSIRPVWVLKHPARYYQLVPLLYTKLQLGGKRAKYQTLHAIYISLQFLLVSKSSDGQAKPPLLYSLPPSLSLSLSLVSLGQII